MAARKPQQQKTGAGLPGHILRRHQETCSEVEVEGANQLSKLTPDNTFYNKAPPPRVSMGFPNNGRHSSFKPPQFRGC